MPPCTMSSFPGWLEHRIPPPVIVVLVALAMWAVSRADPPWQSPEAVRIGIAVALAVAGIGFDFAALVSFRRARTTVNPLKPEQATALVTSGVYRVTRNPMYVGMALLLCAWAAYLWTPWALPGPVAFVAYITRFQIIPEERALVARFGETFESYARSVRRWL